MHVASIELCKELYELSGWETGTTGFNYGTRGTLAFGWFEGALPAYDLGYLLQKLPINQKRFNGHVSKAIIGLQLIRKGTAFSEADYWEASYWHSPRLYCFAAVPEDATCKLAIELFKQGILTK